MTPHRQALAVLASLLASACATGAAQRDQGTEVKARTEIPAAVEAMQAEICEAQIEATRTRVQESIDKVNQSLKQNGHRFGVKIANIEVSDCDVSSVEAGYNVNGVLRVDLELIEQKAVLKADYANLSGCTLIEDSGEQWIRGECEDGYDLESYNLNAIQSAVNEGLLQSKRITIELE